MPFLRYEHADTQYDVPSDLGRAPGNKRDVLTAGLSFRPIPEVIVKLDYQHFWTDAGEFDSYNVGLGFMF